VLELVAGTADLIRPTSTGVAQPYPSKETRTTNIRQSAARGAEFTKQRTATASTVRLAV
jgi:hypothetical protein